MNSANLKKKLIPSVISGLLIGSTAFSLQAEELTVSSWGGFFEETLNEVIYPRFTQETGISVKSIAQPADETWLTQIRNAARANKTPADLSLMSDEALARGYAGGLWMPLDSANLGNLANLQEGFEKLDDEGKPYAVAALSWFNTLVTNTEKEPTLPTSWEELWTRDWDSKLGLVSWSNSGLMEITAVTFFGGYEIMETREGLEQVIDKIAELKPKVRLWYRDEGQFQQGLESGEYNAGFYYHDVTTLAAKDGLPVASTFPKQGGVLSDAYWVVPSKSKNKAAAQAFVNFMLRPDIQAEMALNLGIAPVVRRDLTGLSDEDFAGVASDISPIRVQTKIHLEQGDWLADKYAEMISE